MDIKRRIGLSAAILSVGLGSGHFLQSRAAEAASARQQVGEGAPVPQPAIVAAAIVPMPGSSVSGAATPGDPTDIVPVALTDNTVAPAPALPDTATTAPRADACVPRLDLSLQPRATIGLSLRAACQKGQRVVLRHAGLAVTARTSANGALFMTLPALTPDARVSVLFPDATTVDAAIPVPEAASMRRFAVQWMADDSFQLNAFENGADYGAPGHVWSGNDGLPIAGRAGGGGFLSQVGDPRVERPMLAQVYTYPVDPMKDAELVVEAVVTSQTCDRDLLGETIISDGGSVTVTDLMVAMPGCDATGDILVLKNLIPGPTVTAAN